MSKKRKLQTRGEASSQSASSAASVRARDEFNPDYSYVVRDLRRIAVLAGSFLALLTVLSFFLR